MAERTTRTREEAEHWIPEYLQAAGGSAEGWVIRGAAEEFGFHDKTLRRAALNLEGAGVLYRTHHGYGSERSVTWSLKAPEPVCDACGHRKAVHGLRGLSCRLCPSQACTKRKEASDA